MLDPSASRHRVVFSGRLDNRTDLIRHLNIDPARSKTLTDAGLAELAVEAWGSDCADRLVGDWALAAWDPRTRHLLVARDQTGRVSLFYHHDASRGVLAFASNLSDLLALSGVEQRLSETALAGFAPGTPRFAETVYEDVYRLPPGNLLVATQTDVSVKQYWDVRNLADVRLGSRAEYYDAFDEIFETAVNCRVPNSGVTGTFLSGGLDSSSVASVAATKLAQDDRTLQAFCAVPRFSTKGLITGRHSGDEAELARATARHAGNINVQTVDGSDRGIVAGIRENLDRLREPSFVAGNAFWYLSILQQAADQNIKVLLSGEAGNFTISYAGARREHRAAQSWIGGLKYDIAFVRSGLARRIGSGVFPRALMPRLKSGVGTALNPDFLQSQNAASGIKEFGRAEAATYQSHQRLLVGTFLRASIYNTSYSVAAAYGVEIRDPSFDRRVVEFCLGIPRDMFIDGANRRMLIRTAMAGRLPDRVLNAKTRGKQSADMVRRILAEYEVVDEAMKEIEASPMAQHYLDLPKMRAVLEGFRDTLDTDATIQAHTILLRGLQIGLFLRNMEKA